MPPEKIKENVLKYNWEHWIDRDQGAFFCSLEKGGDSRFFMQKVGVDTELPASVFQNGAWYASEEVWEIFSKELHQWLDNSGDIFQVVKSCEEYLQQHKKTINQLISSKISPKDKLIKMYDIFTQMFSYIWLAHGFEQVFVKKMRLEVPRYISGDIEKIIGDISFPIKKNAHYYFEQALRSEMPLEKVHEKFAWIKARGGFADGFTTKELTLERKRLEKFEPVAQFAYPVVPPELKELVSISQELVYFRTLRTDVLYELMWQARPVLTEIAEHFGLTFAELRDYSALDLMEGKIQKYEYGNFSVASFGEEFAIFHQPIILEKKQVAVTELKGAVAFKGLVQGKVKVVMVAHNIGKVNEGDILVAPTTAPSYIMGMQKAAAFVTDEGGITSHTAIIAREMKKPCIIGTKIATKVLKDEDLVEVDANAGVVKLLKKA
ncbi:MAG: PEP-utilizing enzyme [Patescibacteria group bacterium]